MPEYPHFDLVIKNGTVYDGTGSPGISVDLSIADDTLYVLEPGVAADSAKVIDAAGLAVAPGFIDIHTHSDFTVLFNPKMESSIHQGVTTELFGNCGISVGLLGDGEAFVMERRWAERSGLTADWRDLAGFLGRIESNGVAINVGSLAGHGTIRKRAMGFSSSAPTSEQLDEMKECLALAMEQGAFGLSTGLEYVPGSHANLDEICALAEVARDAGGFYGTHIRNEGDELVSSIAEGIAVGDRTGIAVQLSHHKSEGARNWGKVHTTLRMMDEARERGVDVLTDQYPYTAFMTGLATILLPAWANEGGGPEVVARLKDPEQRAKILSEIPNLALKWENIVIGIARTRREAQGLSLRQLGELDNLPPDEAGLNLLISEEGFVAAAHFAMSEDDVIAVLQDSHTMIGSDGISTAPHGAFLEDKPHPRAYGTFPRVISRYVREKGALSLEEAIRRMTSMPAERMGLADRGVIRTGAKADVVIFDPSSVADVATFENPHQFANGITHVIVNGKISIENGVQTDVLAGRVLRAR